MFQEARIGPRKQRRKDELPVGFSNRLVLHQCKEAGGQLAPLAHIACEVVTTRRKTNEQVN